MEAEFLGIVFRSEDHMRWFQMSMGFVVIIGLISIFSATIAIWKRPVGHRGFSIVLLLMVVAGGYHATAGILSAIHFVIMISIGRDPNGPVYSVDCIWFNFSMAASYISILVVAYLLRKKALKRENTQTTIINPN